MKTFAFVAVSLAGFITSLLLTFAPPDAVSKTAVADGFGAATAAAASRHWMAGNFEAEKRAAPSAAPIDPF